MGDSESARVLDLPERGGLKLNRSRLIRSGTPALQPGRLVSICLRIPLNQSGSKTAEDLVCGVRSGVRADRFDARACLGLREPGLACRAQTTRRFLDALWRNAQRDEFFLLYDFAHRRSVGLAKRQPANRAQFDAEVTFPVDSVNLIVIHLGPLQRLGANTRSGQQTPTNMQSPIPSFARSLRALSAILQTAEAHCEENKIKHEALLTARLFPDMLPLTRNVTIACDSAKGMAARLSQTENPKHEDTETTFAELQERIEKTLAFIESVPDTAFEGASNRTVEMRVGPNTLSFNGAHYFTGFAVPNFYFHMTTSYAILRHNGIKIGKRDFLGPIQ